MGWIIPQAGRAPAIRALAEAKILQLSLFDQQDLAEIASPDYPIPTCRDIACHNPLLAEERARKRDQMLQATEKILDKIVAATRQARRPLQGEAEIGLRVGRLVNKYRMGKHFRLNISDKGFSYERNTESITSEAALDGIYVIRTSVPATELAAEDTVRAYKGLAQVERAFRPDLSGKSVDLIPTRRDYHHLEERVKGHVFLCMLAYYVEWHMRQALAPILFDDDDREAAQAQCGSVVAPAQRSPAAEHKAQTNPAARDRGEPVHPDRSGLLDLATIVFKASPEHSEGTGGQDTQDEPVFERITTPTTLQQRVFELLGVALK